MSLAKFFSEPQLQRLLYHFQRIEDLWQKLVYVKWNPKYFVLLDRLSQDLEQAAIRQGHDKLIELSARLRRHVKLCLAAENIPRRVDRELLTTLLAEIRHVLSSDKAVHTRSRSLSTEICKILVLDDDPDTRWIVRLEEAGFPVDRLTALVEPQATLQQINPSIMIVDVNLRGIPLEGTQMIVGLRANGHLPIPVIFISERDDLEARLEAVRVGGMGYFTKPVDTNALIDHLEGWLLEQSAQHHDRVLLVSEQTGEAEEMVQLLESRGMTTHIVAQPTHAIQEFYRFQPDLLILDLELKTIDGSNLAKVFSQHTACQIVPLILLSSQIDQSHYLARLNIRGASLLLKPVHADYLHWTVAQRLYRARDIRHKLVSLADREITTGLYNWRYFLNQLERSVAALGISLRSVAVILIMLDNLPEIRNSTNVRAAEEIVAQAAGRLRKALGNQHSTARFGDATFIILMTDTNKNLLLETARDLRDILEKPPYQVGEYTELLHTSTGIDTTMDEQENYLRLIQQANIACSMAREARGERIHIHHEISLDQDEDEFQRQRLLETIKEALQQRNLKLMFQPIVSLQEDNHDRYEVLARLYDEKGNELVPEKVFGVTQRHSLGAALDQLIIAEAIQVLVQHQARNSKVLLFIKLLPITLRDKRLPGWLQQQLETHHIEANRLIFQVTETTAQHDLRDLLNFIKEIKTLGCSFGLDRFGSAGSQSIGLLSRVQVDYVKLDMYFVRDLMANQSKQAELKTLVQRLKEGRVATIMSGIEDMRTLPLLWSYGVDYIQGFFLQRPYEKMVYDFSGSF